MKTTLTLPTQAKSRKRPVKRLPLQVIIFITSQKFITFACVIALAVCWYGNFVDDIKIVGFGALSFAISLMPWAWRETIRDMHHPERL